MQTHVCRGNFWRGCWAGEPAWLLARHHQAEAGAHPRSLPRELRAGRLKAGGGEESPKPCRGSPANQANPGGGRPGRPRGFRSAPLAWGQSSCARRVKDDSAGSGRSRLPVGARAPQSSQSHTQTSTRSRGSERRVPGWGRRRERPRGSLVPQAPRASPTSCLRPRDRAFHPAGGGPRRETVNPRASEDSLIPEIQGVRQPGWTRSRSAAPPRPAGRCSRADPGPPRVRARAALQPGPGSGAPSRPSRGPKPGAPRS